LRYAKACSFDALLEALRTALLSVKPEHGQAWFAHCGHLMDMASWTTTLSWFFLGFVGVQLAGVVVVFLSIFSLNSNADATVISLLGLVATALLGAFFFVLLQAIAQVICLLLDIEDNRRQAAGRKA
jgi:hypothetical protein